MSQNIPILELKGTPYEMGLVHGRALREQIVEFTASVTAVHQANNAALSVARDTLSAFACAISVFWTNFPVRSWKRCGASPTARASLSRTSSI